MVSEKKLQQLDLEQGQSIYLACFFYDYEKTNKNNYCYKQKTPFCFCGNHGIPG